MTHSLEKKNISVLPKHFGLNLISRHVSKCHVHSCQKLQLHNLRLPYLFTYHTHRCIHFPWKWTIQNWGKHVSSKETDFCAELVEWGCAHHWLSQGWILQPHRSEVESCHHHSFSSCCREDWQTLPPQTSCVSYSEACGMHMNMAFSSFFALYMK